MLESGRLGDVLEAGLRILLGFFEQWVERCPYREILSAARHHVQGVGWRWGVRGAVSCFVDGLVDDGFVDGFSDATRAEPCVEMASVGKESA